MCLGCIIFGVVVLNNRSFGHFQAHEYGTANGFSEDPSKGRIGFVKTRLSVTKVFICVNLKLRTTCFNNETNLRKNGN